MFSLKTENYLNSVHFTVLNISEDSQRKMSTLAAPDISPAHIYIFFNYFFAKKSGLKCLYFYGPLIDIINDSTV